VGSIDADDAGGGGERSSLPKSGGWRVAFPVFGGFWWGDFGVFEGKSGFAFGMTIATVESVRDQAAGRRA
jgi:hypothetical protein